MELSGIQAAAGARSRAARDSADRHRTTTHLLLITAVLWLVNFAILTTRAAAVDVDSGPRETTIRLGCSIVGAATSLSIYVLFRRSTMSPTRRFLWTAAIFVPMSVLLAGLNELAWLVFTDYYPERYGITAAQFFAGQCTGRHGCADIVIETIYTAGTMFWIYVAWAGLYVGALIAADVRDRDRRLAAAEAAAHEAQVAALRFQLNPHFLFNTLNTLSGLIKLDRKEQAEKVVLNLSAFLRRTVRDTPAQLVSLEQEVEDQKMYLDIERVRFKDRLDVVFEIAPGCEKASVPGLILQPLIENSIKYAVAIAEGKVWIRIAAERRGEDLVLKVENSNPGARHVEGCGCSIGLNNVCKRLDALYGSGATLIAGYDASGGWSNILTIPWKEYEPACES